MFKWRMRDWSFVPRRVPNSVRRIQASKLILLPSCTGLLTGAAAIVFVNLVDLVQWLALGSAELPLYVLPRIPWYQIVLVPVVGGLLVGPLVYFLAPEAAGHGVPEVIEAVMLRGGRIRRRVGALKSLASAVTIGTGGSVGREGPIVHVGAAVGSAVGQALGLPGEQLKTLAACGAAGGIAAVFNAPIAGAFFALEVIIGNFAMPAFAPVVLSSVMATVVSRAYFGDHPAFAVQPYRMENSSEIVFYAGLGVGAALASAAFVWTMDRFEVVAARLPVPRMWKPAAGGLVLGVLILLVPNLYGVGYATMDAALGGGLDWPLLALLVPAKIVATSLTLACGGSGGVFLPALYVGAMLGGLYGSIVHALFPDATAGSGPYALVGMAGVLSGATHAPITALILLFEITGDYALILPVMIVTTIATLLGRGLQRDSLYTLQLNRRGIALQRREDLVMRSHTVSEVMRPAWPVLGQCTSIGEVVRNFLDHEVQRAYVTDTSGRFLGTISIHDIKMPGILDLGPVVIASDVAAPNRQAVAPENTLADSMEYFLLGQDDELPVVDKEGRLVGAVSRVDVLRVYNAEILRHEYLGVAADDERAGRGRVVGRANGLMVAPVETPAWLDGRSLREANLRSTYNLTVVAVRHRVGGSDELPDPEQPLHSGDVLVIVGKPQDIARFRRGKSDAEAQ